MGCRKLLLRGLLVIVILVLIVIGFFLRWRSVRLGELRSNSTIIETSVGPIEYATFGEGMPVVVLHGTIGGYDQGLVIARALQTEDYQFIAMSRPGYLRTPLSAGEDFEGQADAVAALLDALGIEKAAVIGLSGGGPPATQFALRHPERISGLVMIAANSDVEWGRAIQEDEDDVAPPPGWLLPIIFSDFTSWIADIYTQNAQLQTATFLFGEDYAQAVINNEITHGLMNDFLDSVDVIGSHSEGSFTDGANFSNYTGYDWASIETPTLIIVGTRDDDELFEQQRRLHEVLPNSEYIEIEGGTHFMMLSHYEQINPLVLQFFAELESAQEND